MFQTLKPRDKVEGSGMGLAMARKYVEVSGGELKLDSAPGQGSTFSFTWPKTRTSPRKSTVGAMRAEAKTESARLGEGA